MSTANRAVELIRRGQGDGLEAWQTLTEEEAIRASGFFDRLAWAAWKRKTGLRKRPTRWGSRFLEAEVYRALKEHRTERYTYDD